MYKILIRSKVPDSYNEASVWFREMGSRQGCDYLENLLYKAKLAIEAVNRGIVDLLSCLIKAAGKALLITRNKCIGIVGVYAERDILRLAHYSSPSPLVRHLQAIGNLYEVTDDVELFNKVPENPARIYQSGQRSWRRDACGGFVAVLVSSSSTLLTRAWSTHTLIARPKNAPGG